MPPVAQWHVLEYLEMFSVDTWRGIALLALSGMVVAACTGAPQRPADTRPAQAQTQTQACARPALDDPTASAATEVSIGQIAISGTLINRFVAANRAMQAAANADDLATATCNAEGVLYVLVGRFGRNAPPDALTPGMLPADRDPLTDPGLGMAALMIMSEKSAADAIATDILGDDARWRTPTAGWNELDAAVESGTVAEIDSRTMQAIGYARLAQRATSLDEARAHARAGLAATSTALDAARKVLAINCAAMPEVECRV
jgi:hypothetical protein